MQSTRLAGRTILVVEDEPLIALEIVTAFERAGAKTLTARSLADAVRLVERELSAAVLDFGLRDGDAHELCARLNERGIPYVLHSGYTHLGDQCHRGVVVSKPANPNVLIDALVQILGGTNGQPHPQALG